MKPISVRVYAVSDGEVKLPEFKAHLSKFRATRVSTLESEDVNSIIFHVPITQMSNVWTYLRKKRGIKKVWLGR